MTTTRATPEEIMTVNASRELRDGQVCLVGVGPPNAAASRYANINTTVIGPYERPQVRLPGAGGAPEIAAAGRGHRHARALRPRVRRASGLRHLGRPGPSTRAARGAGLPGAGPTVVTTDLGVLRPGRGSGAELELTAIHPSSRMCARRGGRAGGSYASASRSRRCEAFALRPRSKLASRSVLGGSPDEPRQAGNDEPAGAAVTELEHVRREIFRDVIGHFASGVTIITARHGGEDFGVTVNAVSSLSLEPPMMLVCLNRASRTQGAISRSRVFSVNILNENQGDLAVRFATTDSDKFNGIAVHYGELGDPLLDGSLAHLECRVIDEVTGGTHTVYLAIVHRAERFEGAPLAYFRGRFGRLELDQSVPGDADILDPILSRHFYDAVSFFTHG